MVVAQAVLIQAVLPGQAAVEVPYIPNAIAVMEQEYVLDVVVKREVGSIPIITQVMVRNRGLTVADVMDLGNV